MTMTLPLQPPDSHSHTRSQAQSQTHRLSTCHRHPAKPITGFCAICLRERLAGIDPDTRQETPTQNISSRSELRRTKSCSGTKPDCFLNPSSDPPRRRSCDVRARNTLWELFNRDDEKKGTVKKFEVELGNLGFELKEVEETENENENGIGIRVSEDVMQGRENEYEEEDEVDGDVELKTMKEFIDLEWQRKKGSGTGRDFKDIAGTFWEAASVFSKKLRKWRRKPKTKKLAVAVDDGSGGGGGVLVVEKPSARRLRETQSEVGEYGMGRRSCDTDPRLSIDAGRMSLDDSRYSFDEPRASWDGYLIGRVYPRLNPMVSLVEDAKLSGSESENWVSDGERSPGDSSARTKSYYSESLPSQRSSTRSFERSNSLHTRGMMAEVDDLKMISNAKVSPATTELFYGAKVLITETDLKDSKLKSEKDENLESVESGSKDSGSTDPTVGVNQKELKKSQRWHKKWNNIWGLIQRRSEPKCVGEERVTEGNVSDQSVSESWKNPRTLGSVEANGSVGQKLIRSYSMRCRNRCKMAGMLSSNSSGVENRGSSLKRREELMLQRNRSAGYSPNNLDNGLLRFYLTPLRSYRRSKSAKSRLKNSLSVVKSGLVN
ncbi:protein OCTOPUS [Ziziphus jujuba]|uniref:Protein OCTOPUS n=1 Tax=Ziziphus jujuba TaxID=326968 RepID=A0A6P4B4F4_ZIZJJ|nr:protein OCTOPUS [Ziziphus jujuba]